jgi:hypothetical protein
MHSQLAHTAAKLEIADRQRVAERARHSREISASSRSTLVGRARATFAQLRRGPAAERMCVASASVDAVR